jgi:hypothetical protein
MKFSKDSKTEIRDDFAIVLPPNQSQLSSVAQLILHGLIFNRKVYLHFDSKFHTALMEIISSRYAIISGSLGYPRNMGFKYRY